MRPTRQTGINHPYAQSHQNSVTDYTSYTTGTGVYKSHAAMAGKKSTSSKNAKGNERNSCSRISGDEEQDRGSEVKDMFSIILNEIKEIRKQNENLREETRRDIKELKDEIKGFDKKLEEKCRILEDKIANGENTTTETVRRIEDRVKSLEEAEERRQRKDKRNNVVIKSKDFDEETSKTPDDKVKNILRRIECKETYNKAIYIGKDKSDRGLVRVEFKTLDDKIAVMRNKNKLKGEDCYIDADLTRQEREIQQALRTRAREEREKGNIVKVSYQKLLINDQWVNWQTLLQPQAT